MLNVSAVLASMLVMLAMPKALAYPLASDQPAQVKPRAGGGGIGQILTDHFKFVANPPSAKVPIPADENNAAREAHRQVHATLFDVTNGRGGAGNASKGKGNQKEPEAKKPKAKEPAATEE